MNKKKEIKKCRKYADIEIARHIDNVCEHIRFDNKSKLLTDDGSLTYEEFREELAETLWRLMPGTIFPEHTYNLAGCNYATIDGLYKLPNEYKKVREIAYKASKNIKNGMTKEEVFNCLCNYDYGEEEREKDVNEVSYKLYSKKIYEDLRKYGKYTVREEYKENEEVIIHYCKYILENIPFEKGKVNWMIRKGYMKTKIEYDNDYLPVSMIIL